MSAFCLNDFLRILSQPVLTDGYGLTSAILLNIVHIFRLALWKKDARA